MRDRTCIHGLIVRRLVSGTVLGVVGVMEHIWMSYDDKTLAASGQNSLDEPGDCLSSRKGSENSDGGNRILWE